MYHTRKSLYDRSLEKTPEQVFVNSLRREFELSPAESSGILELAKSCLFGEVPQTLGKLKYLCASVNAKHGKPLSEQEMVWWNCCWMAGLRIWMCCAARVCERFVS